MHAQIDPGLARSLAKYQGTEGRRAALAALYGQFLAPGDLFFDIGAHVGEYAWIAHRMGCRVLAVEANPTLYGHLTASFAGLKGFQGASLFVNSAHPSLSSGNRDYVARAEAAGWGEWDTEVNCSALTLEHLITLHGIPKFIKLDIEGGEPAALRGLHPERRIALSFEYTTVHRQSALECLDRLATTHIFNMTVGEEHELANRWRSPEHVKRVLSENPRLWGDIYATPL